MASQGQQAKRDIIVSKDALLKSYRKRLKDDVHSMADNFNEIIKLCKVDDEAQVNKATQVMSLNVESRTSLIFMLQMS